MPYKDPEAKKARNRKYYLENKERIKAEVKARVDPEARAAYYKEYARANRPKLNAINKAYEQRKMAEYGDRSWRKAYRITPEQTRLNSMRKNVAKKQRTPSWFGEFDAFVAREAALLAVSRARITGFDWHVDHIIPMRGRWVSGLHVWNNLRVIPAKVNVRKNNKYDV